MFFESPLYFTELSLVKYSEFSKSIYLFRCDKHIEQSYFWRDTWNKVPMGRMAEDDINLHLNCQRVIFKVLFKSHYMVNIK